MGRPAAQAPTGRAALSIRNLTKTYASGTQALKGVSLDIAEGDFFALLGPNGAGKTTVIGIVMGLVTKTAGTVSVFGHDIDRDHARARKFIGVVPQELNFNIFEKVMDIVVNQGGYYGIPRKVAIERAEEILHPLGLWEKRWEVSRTLSGGMKRRLMIARALVHRPQFLILDEPTAGVDVELRRGMWDYLRSLRESGTTILLTTHYLEEAEQLCKHAAIINHGEIIASGTIKDILARLKSERVTLDLAAPAAQQAAALLAGYRPVVVDPSTVEVEVDEGRGIGPAVVTLQDNDIPVQMVRPKSGRLEEVFLRLTSGNGGAP
ncbi:MAG: ABC transporter ATP-binding protein [Bauldia sp.]|nr:ABC transporter ATP-binding protein [Bauldia sp.]